MFASHGTIAWPKGRELECTVQLDVTSRIDRMLDGLEFDDSDFDGVSTLKHDASGHRIGCQPVRTSWQKKQAQPQLPGKREHVDFVSSPRQAPRRLV
jgi:hypothetical protein